MSAPANARQQESQKRSIRHIDYACRRTVHGIRKAGQQATEYASTKTGVSDIFFNARSEVAHRFPRATPNPRGARQKISLLTSPSKHASSRKPFARAAVRRGEPAEQSVVPGYAVTPGSHAVDFIRQATGILRAAYRLKTNLSTKTENPADLSTKA